MTEPSLEERIAALEERVAALERSEEHEREVGRAETEMY
jgi:hypothetical protein